MRGYGAWVNAKKVAKLGIILGSHGVGLEVCKKLKLELIKIQYGYRGYENGFLVDIRGLQRISLAFCPYDITCLCWF